MTEPSTPSVSDALLDLAAALNAVRLRLGIGQAAEARQVGDELATQITDYLVPRLARLDAPLLVVLGGSTGSGKSTLVNSLISEVVSPAGVLRPTTRAPVLVCHPDDVAWFAGNDVLPDLPRVTGAADDATGAVLRVVTRASMDVGLAVIDAPDIDSVEQANRELATQLLAAADLWLFVTTAVRYADAVPWEFLHRARSRGTALSIVINRIPPGVAGEIEGHLRQMLLEEGLVDVPIHTVQQTELNDGLLPPAAVASIADSLRTLAADADLRAEVVARTVGGALDSIAERALVVAAAAEAEKRAVTALHDVVSTTYDRALQDLQADIANGTLLRGEVLDRWQELIGSAELMRAVQSRISWVRDRLTSFVTGRPAATAQVEGEITSTLERLLIDHADAAALRVSDNWRNMPGGPRVLDDDRSLERVSPTFRAAVAGEIRAWQDSILELVRRRGAGKRTAARALAFGVNSVGVALMIVLFAQTGGITGGEIVIGAGTAGVSQTLLNAIFGEQAVRDLALEARHLLLERVGALLAGETERYRAVLNAAVGPSGAGDELRAALDRFGRVR